MNDDAELLHRFTEDHSEQAFAELVSRHLDRAYAQALRRVGGDTHLAQDVAQQVFTALARQAGGLLRHPSLAGWLHTTTRNLAGHLVRTEVRRKAREIKTATMHELISSDETPVDLGQLREALDEIMDELNDGDRTALLLRFFENLSFVETGRRLHLKENAARMRVERALEKMRELLARRGLKSTGITLATLLAEPIVSAAPAGLAATVTTGALQAAASGAGLGVLTFMSLTKLPWIIAGGLLVAGAAGLLVHERTRAEIDLTQTELAHQRSELVRLEDENRALRASVNRSSTLAPFTSSAAPSPGQSTAGPATASRPRSAKVALASGLIAIDALEHTGRATAQAAFATQLWAAAHGDVELETSAIILTPEARTKLATLITNFPPEEQTRFPTPESMMASVLAGSPHAVGGMRILSETSEGADRAVLETEWQHADDQIVHHSKVTFQRDETGWRFVVPMVLVDRAIAHIASKEFHPPASGSHP